ncbi:MAG: 30S ribosomal protein S6--L-glutamate ligase [Proteobacteria bacterium]|nr:30S ribosomal protein S6--L-glutamate ligase [Pseudomonadota bacterium]
MKLAILSQDVKLYSTRRLKEAAEERGHNVKVIDYMRCYINVATNSPCVMYSGKRLEDYDAVIPRIGASNTFYGTAVVRQFELMGVVPANSSQAISRSRDKLRCMQILAKENIGLPITGFAHSTQDTDGLINMVGGPPVVIKLIEGTQGIGVVLAETYQSAKSMIEAFRGLSAHILVQEFVAEAKGEDIRAFVVGERVIAAMRRKAAPGEFRANIHRGGKSEKIELTDEETETAVRAAKAVGLSVAGVDLLRSKSGPKILEINSSPGLQGIEGATNIDVAGLIIEFLDSSLATGVKAKFNG